MISDDRFIQPIFLWIFFGELEHLWGLMDVIYVDQLSPAWEICGHALSQFRQIWRVFTLFFTWPKFVQQKVPNKKILNYQELTKNSTPKLSPILHWFYSKQHMASFWCRNILLIGDFKNTKAYQNIWGNRWSDQSFFTYKSFPKLTVTLPHKIYDQIIVR